MRPDYGRLRCAILLTIVHREHQQFDGHWTRENDATSNIRSRNAQTKKLTESKAELEGVFLIK
jgi:hypothetical protein